jgi:hypothetical protein
MDSIKLNACIGGKLSPCVVLIAYSFSVFRLFLNTRPGTMYRKQADLALCVRYFIGLCVWVCVF